MIRVHGPTDPPEGFIEDCQQPGNAWLLKNPSAGRPRDFWSPFRSVLMSQFGDRCGYSAMLDLNGTMDHYLSVKSEPSLAYEWANFRYISGWINSSKKTLDSQVLDPFLVESGWFRITLPSLQLEVTEKVPLDFLDIATFTIRRLHLVDDERVLKQRRSWKAMYESGKLTLEGLRDVAPVIAEAIERGRQEEA